LRQGAPDAAPVSTGIDGIQGKIGGIFGILRNPAKILRGVPLCRNTHRSMHAAAGRARGRNGGARPDRRGDSFLPVHPCRAALRKKYSGTECYTRRSGTVTMFYRLIFFGGKAS
jgi:hypothetical protein